MSNTQKYKRLSPEAAVKEAVKSGDYVDYGFGAGFPELMDRALAGRKGELCDVKIRGGLVIPKGIQVVEQDENQETFRIPPPPIWPSPSWWWRRFPMVQYSL